MLFLNNKGATNTKAYTGFFLIKATYLISLDFWFIQHPWKGALSSFFSVVFQWNVGSLGFIFFEWIIKVLTYILIKEHVFF